MEKHSVSNKDELQQEKEYYMHKAEENKNAINRSKSKKNWKKREHYNTHGLG